MLTIAPCPIQLDGLAARIRASSNFRFAWQTYDEAAHQLNSDRHILRSLAEIVEREELHGFLRDSFDPMYDPVFDIQPLHEHCQLLRNRDGFANILASAAADTLGAYSSPRRRVTDRLRGLISVTFSRPGPFDGYVIEPGAENGCTVCREHNHHLFTNWFYGVAWDWCLIAVWRETNQLWLGCLTDTD